MHSPHINQILTFPERGGKAAATAEIAEGTVRHLHARIAELAVANDFLARKLKPWTGK